MATQSEAALEQGLIKALQDMSYEYVKISEETNLHANFKAQLEKHNRKELAKFGREHFTDTEFDRILIYLEGGSRFDKVKKQRAEELLALYRKQKQYLLSQMFI